MFAFLGTIQAKIIGFGLLAVAIGGIFIYVYNKGGAAERAAITSAVQKKTIETLDKARATKEQADKDVSSQPYAKTVDELK